VGIGNQPHYEHKTTPIVGKTSRPNGSLMAVHHILGTSLWNLMEICGAFCMGIGDVLFVAIIFGQDFLYFH
jgi:hypothetical protein